MAETKTILVKSGLTGEHKDRLALHEVDPKHPHLPNQEAGEVFIYGQKPVEAGETAAVQKALAEGRLVRAEADTPAKKGKDAE